MRDQAGAPDGRWVATLLQRTAAGWRRVVDDRYFPDREQAEKWAAQAATNLPKQCTIPANDFQERGGPLFRRWACVPTKRTSTQMLDAAPQGERGRSDEDGQAGLSDTQLHRATRQAIGEADRAVFGNLAGLIGEVIDRQLWCRAPFHFASFAAYCLAGNGLRIDTNSKLWLLRCCLEVNGRHLPLWASVLTQVEAMVRVAARKNGQKLGSAGPFGGNSLGRLAKDRALGNAPINYLPSMQRGPGAIDGHLVRLQKKKPDVFERVVGGELSLADALRKTGAVRDPSPFDQLRRLIEKHLSSLTATQKATLRGMLA
jgi:hypothetical protein